LSTDAFDYGCFAGMLTYIEMQRGMASKEFSSLDAIKKHLTSSSEGVPVISIAFFSSADDATFSTYDEASEYLH